MRHLPREESRVDFGGQRRSHRKFRKAIAGISGLLVTKIWFDAPSMIQEIEGFLSEAGLISLDHDLNPQADSKFDPGTGLDVAEYLAKMRPVCPVILHSSNFERVWSMHNELNHSGWQIERVGPLGNDWIETSWTNKVRALLKNR